MVDLTVPLQRLRAVVQDHMLEPDAMRGTEHYLRNIKDAEGNAITPVDEEEARRQFMADAVQSRAPIRVSSSMTQTPNQEVNPPAVPVSEVPPSSPNVMRAPLTVGDPTRATPVQTDSGTDWQARARAEGWAPPGEKSDPQMVEYRAPSGPPVDPKYQAPYTRPVAETPVPYTPPAEQSVEPGTSATETTPPSTTENPPA